MFKVRFVVLSLLALFVLGSVGSATASAEPGPFWHHRALNGTEFPGEKIEKAAKEKVSGESNAVTLKGKAGGLTLQIKCKLKFTGTIWNEEKQGQGSFETKFTECGVAERLCPVTVVTTGEYPAHLMWKYLGNSKELEQIKPQSKIQGPELLIIPPGVELTQAGGLKEEKSFATVEISTEKGCGEALGGLKTEVAGATVAVAFKPAIEHFAQTTTFLFLGQNEYRQHYWNGERQVQLKVGLKAFAAPATFSAEVPTTAEKQEIAIFPN